MSHMKDLAIKQMNDETLIRNLKDALIDALSDCNDYFVKKRIREAIDGCNDYLKGE